MTAYADGLSEANTTGLSIMTIIEAGSTDCLWRPEHRTGFLRTYRLHDHLENSNRTMEASRSTFGRSTRQHLAKLSRDA